MTSPFHLLKLPQVAQRHLFQEFSAVEILNLSFTSTRVRHTIQSIRLRAIEHTVYFDSPYPRFETVYKKDNGLNEHVLEWKFVGKEDLAKLIPFEIQIGCHNFKKCAVQSHTIFTEYHNPEFGATVVFNHIVENLPGPVNLHLNLEHIRNLHAILLNENFRNCRKFDIIDGWNGTSHDEDLNGILDSVNVEKELVAYLIQEDKLDIEKINSLEAVTLRSANWLTFPDLLSLKCRTGKFLSHTLSQSNLLSFAENWYNSTDRTLESVQFGWDENVPFDLTDSSLCWNKWDRKIRSRYYFIKNEEKVSNRIDCSEGYDITRPDGLTATFLLQNHFDCTVTFFVWHDPHPETIRLKELDVLVLEEIAKFENVCKARNKFKSDVDIAEAVRNLIDKPEFDYQKYTKWRRTIYLLNKETEFLYSKIADKIFGFKNEIVAWKKGMEQESCNSL